MTIAVKMRKVRRSSPAKCKRTKGNAKTGVVKGNSTTDVDEKAKTGRNDISWVRNKTCCTADSNFVHAHLRKEGNNRNPSAGRATCGVFLIHFLTIIWKSFLSRWASEDHIHTNINSTWRILFSTCLPFLCTCFRESRGGSRVT